VLFKSVMYSWQNRSCFGVSGRVSSDGVIVGVVGQVRRIGWGGDATDRPVENANKAFAHYRW
jgi:hypothetical protein